MPLVGASGVLRRLRCNMAEKGNATTEIHLCGECVNCTPIYDFHTLTVKDRKPTMGTCPYWTSSRCVLLSQRACKKHYKEREQVTLPSPTNTAHAG